MHTKTPITNHLTTRRVKTWILEVVTLVGQFNPEIKRSLPLIDEDFPDLIEINVKTMIGVLFRLKLKESFSKDDVANAHTSDKSCVGVKNKEVNRMSSRNCLLKIGESLLIIPHE